MYDPTVTAELVELIQLFGWLGLVFGFVMIWIAARL